MNVANKCGTSFFIWHQIKRAAAFQALKLQATLLCVERESGGRKYVQLHTQWTVISLLNTTHAPVGYLM